MRVEFIRSYKKIWIHSILVNTYLYSGNLFVRIDIVALFLCKYVYKLYIKCINVLTTQVYSYISSFKQL